jgi:hypothetical protein
MEVVMDWEGMRRSENVEDRRASFGRPMGLGIGGLLLAVIIGWILGVDPVYLLNMVQDGGDPSPGHVSTRSVSEDPGTDFVRAILGDTEDTWSAIFQQSGSHYADPKLVLFNGAVQSACGFASSAAGPFYCSRDAEVYLDLSFFQELQQRFGAPGDFARAYVIAHEVGHHVQNLLGITDKVQTHSGQSDATARNALSVRLELQADCFAGIWGHYTAQRGLIDQTDIAAALHAASQIGDDRLQKRSQGYVVPEAFTHGSAAQRTHWFQRGLKSGDPNQCNTFTAQQF